MLKSLFDRLCTWLSQVMSEGGASSSIRVTMLVWHVPVVFVWTVLSLYKRELVHIDESVLGVLAATMTAKVVQKGREGGSPQS